MREFIARSAPSGTLEKLDKTFASDARDAEENSERIAQQLTAEQLDKALKLALAWKPGKLMDDPAP
jgi:hypothetical protein